MDDIEEYDTHILIIRKLMFQLLSKLACFKYKHHQVQEKDHYFGTDGAFGEVNEDGSIDKELQEL